MATVERSLDEIHQDILRMGKKIAELKQTINNHLEGLDRQVARHFVPSERKKFSDCRELIHGTFRAAS